MLPQFYALIVVCGLLIYEAQAAYIHAREEINEFSIGEKTKGEPGGGH